MQQNGYKIVRKSPTDSAIYLLTTTAPIKVIWFIGPATLLYRLMIVLHIQYKKSKCGKNIKGGQFLKMLFGNI